MVFGLSDKGRNISNATIERNIFMRNGAIQTSDDRGSIVLMEMGSSGKIINNTFFAEVKNESFAVRQRVPGIDQGFEIEDNSVLGVDDISIRVAPTPALGPVSILSSGEYRLTLVCSLALEMTELCGIRVTIFHMTLYILAACQTIFSPQFVFPEWI